MKLFMTQGSEATVDGEVMTSITDDEILDLTKEVAVRILHLEEQGMPVGRHEAYPAVASLSNDRTSSNHVNGEHATPATTLTLLSREPRPYGDGICEALPNPNRQSLRAILPKQASGFESQATAPGNPSGIPAPDISGTTLLPLMHAVSEDASAMHPIAIEDRPADGGHPEAVTGISNHPSPPKEGGLLRTSPAHGTPQNLASGIASSMQSTTEPVHSLEKSDMVDTQLGARADDEAFSDELPLPRTYIMEATADPSSVATPSMSQAAPSAIEIKASSRKTLCSRTGGSRLSRTVLSFDLSLDDYVAVEKSLRIHHAFKSVSFSFSVSS